jgi:HAE1 family hydrophobic/amphiphilic exporter-1
MIMVQFYWGTDLNYATNQLRDRLDLYGSLLPSEATKPTIVKLDPGAMPIIQIGLSGAATLEELTDYMVSKIRPNLERIDGIASVNDSGTVTAEILITTDPQRLQVYGVSMSQIVALLRQENANVSAGSVEEGLRDHTVRVVGQFTDLDDIRYLQVQSAYGGFIPLHSLADIERTIRERTSYVFINGNPGINISLMKQSDSNLVQTSARVREVLKEIKADLPASYEIAIAYDQADYINLSINNVIDSAIQGCVLAILILIVFLRSWRSTLIIALAIPISVIAAFAIMFFTKVTLNVISLGGLGMGVGMMVDNSIVILENIFRHRQEEDASSLGAAINGGKEVAGAVIASTVTTIVVFMPIVFVEGLASQVFGHMALTITCSLLASLGVSFLLVPMMSNILLVKEKAKKKDGKFVTGVRDGYRRFLTWSLRRKGTIATSFTVALIASLFLVQHVGVEFFPAQETGQYSLSISLPRGVTMREKLRVAQLAEAILNQVPENARILNNVGSGDIVMSLMGRSGGGAISITGNLVPATERERSTDEILDDIRERLSFIPGIEYEVMSNGGNIISMETDIVINLLGDDIEQLNFLADAVAQQIELIRGTRQVTTSQETGNPEISVVVDRQKAAQYGMNSSTVASTVSAAVNGISPTKLREGGKELDIRVIMDDRYRQNLNDLESMTIASPSGNLIPLGNIATLSVGTSPVSIVRQNQSRQVSVSCIVVGRSLGEVAADVQTALDRMNIPPEIQIDMGGSNNEMMKAFRDLFLALLLAVLLVYMVMAFQFEQMLYPFVIMFALPPTFIGVIVCLYITGRTLNVVSLIGVIMLVGIVVNNAIVLVDYINTLRRDRGRSRDEAIIEAGLTRLRPIMMTSLTTILGMLPLTIGSGEGREIMAPLGTVVAGGLTFSTFITLIYVPCMYVYAENITNGIRNLFRRKPVSEVEAEI